MLRFNTWIFSDTKESILPKIPAGKISLTKLLDDKSIKREYKGVFVASGLIIQINIRRTRQIFVAYVGSERALSVGIISENGT